MSRILDLIIGDFRMKKVYRDNEKRAKLNNKFKNNN